MEMGNSGSTDTATLTFTFSGTSTTRTWEIKATQIPCAAEWRQPEGCLQYHTTLVGRFQTFNFLETTTPMHLASQEYVHAVSAYKKCLYKKQLVDGLQVKKRTLVDFYRAKKRSSYLQ